MEVRFGKKANGKVSVKKVEPHQDKPGLFLFLGIVALAAVLTTLGFFAASAVSMNTDEPDVLKLVGPTVESLEAWDKNNVESE